MARPQKNTVDYFPHYIGNGKKMSFIESKYGNDGYATWFKILETLAETEYHYLNLSKQVEIMFLSTKCRIDEEKLINIINDLVILEVFSSEAWAHKILWSETFMKSISDAYRKRESKTHDLNSLFRHLHINQSVSDVGNGESKGKEIKEEEIKENESANNADAPKKTKKIDFDFKGTFLNLGVEESVLNDWLLVRDKKKGTNSKTAFNGFLREVEKAKISFNEAVTVCAERSWITFTAEYYFNLKNSNKNGKQQITNNAKESVTELGRLADQILANAGQNNSTNNIF